MNMGAGVPQIRSQVGISQQQRLPPGTANRLTAQQLLQAQQAQAARALAAAQAQANGMSGVGLGMVGVNGGSLQIPGQHHLQPPYPQRTQSASPGHINVQAAQQGQVGPPQGSPLSRPASAVNVGPGGVQVQMGPSGLQQQQQQQQMLQQQQTLAHYYQLAQNGQLTTEQMTQAMQRMQGLQNMINVSYRSGSSSCSSLVCQPRC